MLCPCSYNKQQAQEIGRRMFKSFLIAGGHPNPDKPGRKNIEGLTASVYVGMGKPYQKNEITVPEISLRLSIFGRQFV